MVKSKPHERIDLLITASVNIYQTKIPIVIKTCFSKGKLKQFGNPPPLTKSTPPSTNLGFLSNSFMTPLFVQISKTRYPPNFRGEETMTALLSLKLLLSISQNISSKRWLQGYLCYKTITSQNAVSEAQVEIFFVSWESYVPFSRYSSFCIFNHLMIYQICDIMMSINTRDRVHF